MKLMIASDIHGSAKWCAALLSAHAAERPDRLLLLGDLLYHGPRNDLPEDYAPKRVIEMLNALAPAPLCVRGNCEAEVDQMVLSFPVMAEFAALWLDGHALYATHGHARGPQNPPPLAPGDVLLCGHTHIPEFRDCGGFTAVNPGSVSIPKKNTPHSYCTLEDGELLFRDLGNACAVYDRKRLWSDGHSL